MPLFWKPYKSEITQFLDELKARRPEIEEGQRLGRAIFWDKEVDRDAQQDYKAARVAQQPYVYQTKGE
ncbi:DUF3460 family protein [Caldimonas tepidiphila]|uniref:DUF3460 family protein n=1 Tax=Caldimonas tepidiphila TaxID=2315841 RepID=UPI000E5A61F1|nr:DUF3460 family protein [Caldimonas tepidiphila]